MTNVERDDVGPLALSLVALAVMTFALGIFLVPVWSPEVIPVAAALAVVLTLFAQLLSLRNAFHRREFWWMPLILLFGPLGVLSYSTVKATESGLLASYFDELSQHTTGRRESE